MENVIVKITCWNCKKSWKVSWLDIGKKDVDRCPICGQRIDKELWKKDILPTAGAALDCNMELARYADGYNKTHFSVDFLRGKAR